MGAAKQVRKSKEEGRVQQGRAEKEWSISKVLAREKEGGIVGSGGGGLLCFLQSCPSVLPGGACFPFIRASGAECKWRAVAQTANRPQGPALNEHTLKSKYDGERRGGRVISRDMLDMHLRERERERGRRGRMYGCTENKLLEKVGITVSTVQEVLTIN